MYVYIYIYIYIYQHPRSDEALKLCKHWLVLEPLVYAAALIIKRTLLLLLLLLLVTIVHITTTTTTTNDNNNDNDNDNDNDNNNNIHHKNTPSNISNSHIDITHNVRMIINAPIL